MDGQYGDSTRTVKAVGSEAIPGQPVAPMPVHRFDVPPLSRRDRAARQLRPQLQSDVAATGVGIGRTRGRIDGVDVRVWDGRDHVGATGAGQARQEARRAGRRLLPGAPICGRIPCATRHNGGRGEQRRHVRRVVGRRRGARGDSGQSRARRRRPASAGDDLPQAAAPSLSSTTPPPPRWVSSRCRWGPTSWWPVPPRRCRVTAICSRVTSRAVTPS